MKDIVKVLLQEGIDEEVIHEIISLIEEKYEIIDEESKGAWRRKLPGATYHGTKNDFNKFDLNKSGSANDHGMYGKGIYTTDNLEIARGFGGEGGHVKKVEMNFKNPLFLKNNKRQDAFMKEFEKNNQDKIKSGVYQTNAEDGHKPTGQYSQDFRNYVASKGYDGIISPKHCWGRNESGKRVKGRQYVALNPEQCKITGKVDEK